jgi:hypothetical protein
MPPDHPQFDPERHFALIDEPHMLPAYLITNVAEAEVNHRLVARLLENNMHDPNSKVNKLHLLEMANAALEAKREEEWRAEKKDVMKSIMKSNKNTYRHDGQTLRR